eukprot:7382215-Prymnesium_polylepis.1
MTKHHTPRQDTPGSTRRGRRVSCLGVWCPRYLGGAGGGQFGGPPLTCGRGSRRSTAHLTQKATQAPHRSPPARPLITRIAPRHKP